MYVIFIINTDFPTECLTGGYMQNRLQHTMSIRIKIYSVNRMSILFISQKWYKDDFHKVEYYISFYDCVRSIVCLDVPQSKMVAGDGIFPHSRTVY